MRSLLIGLSLALAAAAGAQPRGSVLDRAYDEVLAAQASLKRAEEAQKAGVEPRPGERIGTAAGGTRFTDEYLERQKRLEEEVAHERMRVDEALKRWNAVR
jgi:hypothetical protein